MEYLKNIKGLDSFQNRLNQLEKSAKKLNGTHTVPLSELFTRSFMTRHTKFQTFEELLETGGFVVNTTEDFEAIPDDVLDDHISKNTDFSSWSDMSSKAASAYVLNKLRL